VLGRVGQEIAAASMLHGALSTLLLVAPVLGWTAGSVGGRSDPMRVPPPPLASAQTVAKPVSSTVTASSDAPMTPLLSSFLAHFRGHFDNHEQVLAEQVAGLAPREGGGHEHIHCSLQPIALSGQCDGRHVLATYYFNGNPSTVFRERVYEFDALSRDPQFGECVRMRIFRTRDDVAAKLRAGLAADDVAWSVAEDLDEALHVSEADVFWRWCGERYEGAMRTESIEIISERSGRPITVRDDVALWEDALWVNDRGSDAATGAYVYGNIRDIPYKMSRVPDDHWTVHGPSDEESDER